MSQTSNKELNRLSQIAAIVVTYNRKRLLGDCLESLLLQRQKPDAIFVIDNASTDGTQEWLKKKGFLKEGRAQKPKFIYIRLSQNTGGAGGFYEGMKRAYEEGYGYFWLMDDDVVVPENVLFELFTALKDIEKKIPTVFAICPRVQHESGLWEDDHHKFVKKTFLQEVPWTKKYTSQEKFIFLDTNSFVGPLIKREAIENVGFPEPKLFIRGDDTEYTYRLSRKGAVLLMPGIVIIHRDEKRQMEERDLWKFYYSFRNKVWFIQKFHPYHIMAYLYYFLSAIKWSINFLLTFGKKKSVFYPLIGFFSALKFTKKYFHFP